MREHIPENEDLEAVSGVDELPIPESWGAPVTGRPLPSIVAIVRGQRAGH